MKIVLNIIGRILFVLMFILVFIFGLGGIGRIVQDFGFESSLHNFCAFMIAIIIFPITLAAGPWFTIIKYGDWLPLILIYGGGFLVMIIGGLASKLVEIN